MGRVKKVKEELTAQIIRAQKMVVTKNANEEFGSLIDSVLHTMLSQDAWNIDKKRVRHLTKKLGKHLGLRMMYFVNANIEFTPDVVLRYRMCRYLLANSGDAELREHCRAVAMALHAILYNHKSEINFDVNCIGM